MLVLSRKHDEEINIGDETKVMVVEIRDDKVRLGVTAPRHVRVHRGEVWSAIQRELGGGPMPIDPAAAQAAASLLVQYARQNSGVEMHQVVGGLVVATADQVADDLGERIRKIAEVPA